MVASKEITDPISVSLKREEWLIVLVALHAEIARFILCDELTDNITNIGRLEVVCQEIGVALKTATGNESCNHASHYLMANKS
jgi:hypothetical protein